MAFDLRATFRDCPWCGLRDAQMSVRGNFQAERIGNSPRWWTTLSCPRCGTPILIETNAPKSGQAETLSVFPDRTVGDEVQALPEDVAGYYRDALIVLRAGVPDAAAVQLRRTLEAAAAHFEIKENALIKSIEKLIELGFVTKSFGKVLHHVREIGNVGAHHTDKRVDEASAQRALRFTTALLRNLFEVPAELDAIQKDAKTAS